MIKVWISRAVCSNKKILHITQKTLIDIIKPRIKIQGFFLLYKISTRDICYKYMNNRILYNDNNTIDNNVLINKVGI